MTSPLTKIWPLPLPDATPRSASRASPGPFTTQPMTATRSGAGNPSSAAVTWSASVYTSTWARPHDGHETISSPRSRRPSDSRIAEPTLTSSTGGADSDTRIVSPMPSASNAPNATDDLMVPWNAGPASVTPRCSGYSQASASCRYAWIITTGSWCFTEILMSRKPCSSNSEHSQSADSTSASGVALPYLASSRLSSEPAFTPMRMGVPASAAARAISAILSSNCLMLPGFTRTAAQPASIAANTYLGWKWMSAMTGICDFLAIAGSASASSCDGTATRTIWQPDAVSSAICCKVAFTFAVSVVVIDWTDTGAPPPTGTLPTMSWRDFRRSASGAGGVSGMPRSTLIGVPSRRVIGTLSGLRGLASRKATVYSHPVPGPTNRTPDPYVRWLPNVHRIDDVREDEHRPEDKQDQEDAEAHRGQLAVVDQAGIGPP